ncbi:MAG TPA: carboxy terminal-processing peptidase [Sphingobacteriaceae bacterium]
MDYKSFKEMLKKIFLALFIAGTLACKADPRVKAKVDGVDNLQPDAQQSLITRELVNLIENFHYKKVTLNDSISNVIYTKYLETLDPTRSYFLKSDVEEFEKFRNTFDDDLSEGDLSAPFYMYNVFQKRYTERINYSLNQITKPFDFSKSETYTYNREKLPYFANIAESDKNWQKRIKYELLNLKLAGSDPAKNAETLKQRYTNLLSLARKVNNQDVFQRLMDAFTESIDPHTNYFNPNNAQAFNENMARTFEGIGARLQQDNEVVKVAEIIPGGPAFKAKTLAVNDKIIGVAQGDGEFVDIIGWRIDAAVTKIKGPKGTRVRLKIIPAGQELSAKPKIIELTRDKVVLEDQSAKKTIKTIRSGDKDYRIGVIEIPAFYLDFKAYQSGDPNFKSTSRDVRLLLDTLKQQKVDGVVIDLRANGGGSLIEAIELTGLFIKTGPVVQVRDTRGRIEVDEDDDASIAWDGPLGVMIDRFSASASEIFAGAIQDYGRGIIVGTQTYGKGTVQSAIDMSRVIKPTDAPQTADGSKGTALRGAQGGAPKYGQINLTMGKFYRINGSSTQHKGVIPDISFPMVFPADKYGESSEPAALPWDEIRASNYHPLANLAGIKSQLTSLHEQRMKTSEEYKFLLEDIAEFKKRENETSVTLNEVQLKKEREDQENRNLARENRRRALAGLAPLKKGETDAKNSYDFIQDESLRIMTDFIKLGQTNQLTFK